MCKVIQYMECGGGTRQPTFHVRQYRINKPNIYIFYKFVPINHNKEEAIKLVEAIWIANVNIILSNMQRGT